MGNIYDEMSNFQLLDIEGGVEVSRRLMKLKDWVALASSSCLMVGSL